MSQHANGTRAGQRDLINAPINSTLLLFALPTLASSVLQSLNGSINAIWVGRLLGEEALAATTNGNIVMFMMIAFVFGFGMAATILIGQALGRRNLNLARRIIGTAIGSFIPVVAIVAALGWIYAPQLLAVLGTPDTVAPLALDYLRVIFIGIPPMLMATLLMMALRGSGDAMTPLWFMGLTSVLDSGLNPVFILGLGPAPELGIAGAATATAIANIAGLIGLVVYIYRRDLPLRLRGPEWAYLRPDLTQLKPILTKGVPMGLQMIVVSSAALTILGLINREGVDVTAAYGATQQLWTYVQMPAMALGAAVSAMVAQNIGAGRWDRVAAITRAGVIFNLGLTGSLVVLLTLADKAALALFLGSDSPSVAIGRHIQLVATWGYIAFGVSLVLFGAIRANGEVIKPLIIMVVAMYPIRLGFAWGAHGWLGADAIWLSFPIGMVATMVMSIVLYKFGNWKAGSVLPENDDVDPYCPPAQCAEPNAAHQPVH